MYSDYIMITYNGFRAVPLNRCVYYMFRIIRQVQQRFNACLERRGNQVNPLNLQTDPGQLQPSVDTVEFIFLLKGHCHISSHCDRRAMGNWCEQAEVLQHVQFFWRDFIFLYDYAKYIKPTWWMDWPVRSSHMNPIELQGVAAHQNSTLLFMRCMSP